MSRRAPQDPRSAEISSVADQAADWLRILQDPRLVNDNSERFLNWAKESPLHVKEFLMAYATYRKLDRSGDLQQFDLGELISCIAPNVRPIGAHAMLPASGPRKPRRRSLWLAGVAAAIAVVAVAIYWLALRNTYSTTAGEQLRVSLKDGSGVYLNSRSRVRVDFNAQARDVYLEQGQALFEVERDPMRPFRVHAARTVIQAVGTQFDVRLLPHKVAVAVVEGTVRVSSLSQVDGSVGDRTRNGLAAQLSAGQATTIGAAGQIARPVAIDIDTAMSWWQQQLVFERTPLSQIAAEFNRYNRLQIRIEGDAVGRKQFNGVFGSRKPEAFLAYLANDGSLTFERRGDEVVIREAQGDSDLIGEPQ